jgi:hypothetical protein
MRTSYEQDLKTFPADAYKVENYAGQAWRVRGWQLEDDADTEWTGYQARTGLVVAVMVGDDRAYAFDPQDLSPLNEADYCNGCGQIGCSHG